jgi:hypothetical protein
MGEKTPNQLGPAEWVSSPPPSPEDRNRSSFRNVVFFGIQDDGKSPQQFCEFCTTYIIVRILSSLPGDIMFVSPFSYLKLTKI